MKSKLTCWFIVVVFLTETVAAFCASAQNMEIARFYDIFTNNQSVLTKTITNHSSSTLYLEVGIARVEHPFSKTQKAIPLNPKEMAQTIMVLNPAVIVPPNQSAKVKFVLPQGRPTTAKFFYISFTPVIPTEANGFYLSKKQKNTLKKQRIQAQAHFSIAVSTFMAVDPKGAKDNRVHVTKTHDGRDLLISNSGNSVAMVTLSGSIKDKAKLALTKGAGKSKSTKIGSTSYNGVSLILPRRTISIPLKNFLGGNVSVSVTYNPAKPMSQNYEFTLS